MVKVATKDHLFRIGETITDIGKYMKENDVDGLLAKILGEALFFYGVEIICGLFEDPDDIKKWGEE